MTILHIEAKTGDFTVYLEHPIKKPRLITLRSCAFYNKHKNLSSDGFIYDGLKSIIDSAALLKIPKGCYRLETLEDQLSSVDSITIENSKLTTTKYLLLNSSLTSLLGLKKTDNLRIDEFGAWVNAFSEQEIRFKAPLDVFYIHCNLVKPWNSLNEGKPSQILACVELDSMCSSNKVKFRPNNPEQLSVSSSNFVSSLNFSIRDANGDILEGDIYPIRLTLEII